MTTSVLTREYNSPTRPYSKNELTTKYDRFIEKFKLNTKLLISHEKCGHKYYVKINSKKEQSMLEGNTSSGCSVCWRLYNTVKPLREGANDLNRLYQEFINNYQDDPDQIEYFDIFLNTVFYTWLYGDKSSLSKREEKRRYE